MSRTPATPKSLVAEFTASLERIVAAARAEGRDAALAEVRGLIGGGASLANPLVAAKKRGRPLGSKNKKPAANAAAAAKAAKSSKSRKSSWSGLTPEQHLARVNAIRIGRGLPTKSSL